MNSLLFIPAPFVDRGKIVAYVPYGLLSLQAVASGHESSIDVLQLHPLSGKVFSSSDELARGVVDLVQADRYGVVGLSTMCSSFHHSVGIASELKRRHPRLRIWMGGPHVSVHAQAALASYSEIEAVFVGEAEETFHELLMRQDWADGRSPAGLPGVATREEPLVPRGLIATLDNLPYIGDAHDFVASLSGAGYAGSEIPLEVERGCTGRCSFCSTSLYWGRRVRRKSIGRLLGDMRRLTTLTGLTSVSLIGDNLATSRRWLLEFCQGVAREAPGGLINWGCSLTLSNLQVEDLDILWKSRCRRMFVGLESASQATLNRIGKRIDLDKSLMVLDCALARGFRVNVSLIIGFPWETSSDLRDTYNLHMSLLRRGAESQVTTLCPLPGTCLEQTETVHPGDGISTTAFDGLPHGPIGEEIVRRCPRLFSQFGRFDTPSVDLIEVGAIARAATMASNHYGARI